MSEGDSASRRIFGTISSAGAVPMPEKRILLQESFIWRHVSQAASIPSHFLVFGEETARPFRLALSLAPLGSFLDGFGILQSSFPKPEDRMLQAFS